MMTLMMPQRTRWHARLTKPRLHYAMPANTRALITAILRPNFDQFLATK